MDNLDPLWQPPPAPYPSPRRPPSRRPAAARSPSPGPRWRAGTSRSWTTSRGTPARAASCSCTGRRACSTPWSATSSGARAPSGARWSRSTGCPPTIPGESSRRASSPRSPVDAIAAARAILERAGAAILLVRGEGAPTRFGRALAAELARCVAEGSSRTLLLSLTCEEALPMGPASLGRPNPEPAEPTHRARSHVPPDDAGSTASTSEAPRIVVVESEVAGDDLQIWWDAVARDPGHGVGERRRSARRAGGVVDGGPRDAARAAGGAPAARAGGGAAARADRALAAELARVPGRSSRHHRRGAGSGARRSPGAGPMAGRLVAGSAPGPRRGDRRRETGWRWPRRWRRSPIPGRRPARASSTPRPGPSRRRRRRRCAPSRRPSTRRRARTSGSRWEADARPPCPRPRRTRGSSAASTSRSAPATWSARLVAGQRRSPGAARRLPDLAGARARERRPRRRLHRRVLALAGARRRRGVGRARRHGDGRGRAGRGLPHGGRHDGRAAPRRSWPWRRPAPTRRRASTPAT